MRASLVLVVAFAVLGFFPASPVRAQEDAASKDKMDAEIKAELAAALKKFKQPKGKVKAETKLMVIPLRTLDVKEAAKLVKKVYRGTPGLVVEPLPKLKVLIIRADEKTLDEICDLLTVLQ